MGRREKFREWLKRSFRNDGMPFIRNAWCGIFRDTDHPCREQAVCLMSYSNRLGFAEAIFVCDRHHPDKNPWTRRHFELHYCRIISVEELQPRPAA